MGKILRIINKYDGRVAHCATRLIVMVRTRFYNLFLL